MYTLTHVMEFALCPPLDADLAKPHQRNIPHAFSHAHTHTHTHTHARKQWFCFKLVERGLVRCVCVCVCGVCVCVCVSVYVLGGGTSAHVMLLKTMVPELPPSLSPSLRSFECVCVLTHPLCLVRSVCQSSVCLDVCDHCEDGGKSVGVCVWVCVCGCVLVCVCVW